MWSFTKVRWYSAHSSFRYLSIFLARLSTEGKTVLKNDYFMLLQSISLRSSGLLSAVRSTKLLSVMYSVSPSISHLIFLMCPLLINSYSKCFEFAISRLSMLRKLLIDVADADIFFFFILISPSFGSLLLPSFLSYVSPDGSYSRPSTNCIDVEDI